MPAPKHTVMQSLSPWEGRRVAKPIVDCLCQLSAKYRAVCNSAEQRALEKRILQLESYVIVPLSHGSRYKERDDVVMNYVKQLCVEWPGPWKEFREAVDRFEKSISAKPKGRPTDYRCKVTEALGLKLADPSRPWKQIARDLQLNPAYLNREVHRLRTLLRREQITVPPATS
ncbi:MAG: hypothetical protein ACRD4Q_09335 [Candidatus Acidiferrales bacterium]